MQLNCLVGSSPLIQLGCGNPVPVRKQDVNYSILKKPCDQHVINVYLYDCSSGSHLCCPLGRLKRSFFRLKMPETCSTAFWGFVPMTLEGCISLFSSCCICLELLNLPPYICIVSQNAWVLLMRLFLLLLCFNQLCIYLKFSRTKALNEIYIQFC